jgi:hypothetical protein
MICFILVTQIPNDINAQPTEKMYQGVLLDEVVVKAMHAGFDAGSFIRRVKSDTSFYRAFKNLRTMSYTMYNDIQINDKKAQPKATYSSITKQTVQNNCRSMAVLREQVEGNFYKRNKIYRYQTAKLYAHLFFTEGILCADSQTPTTSKSGTKAKYEEQLKQLIFNPGKPISGIPGIGKNIQIFDEPYFSKYIFRLSRGEYLGEACYIFKAIPKQMYANDVVINELKTWFRVSDFSIVARDYALSFSTPVYDFDVIMHVKLKPVGLKWVPYEISYKGNWHVFTQSREIATFTAIFTDFE